MEESGRQTIGWIRAAGIINRMQDDCHKRGYWLHDVEDNNVYVLHAPVLHPTARGMGSAWRFSNTMKTML